MFGSAVGPALSGLVESSLGYRGMFGLLAAIGMVATAIVISFVPETMQARQKEIFPSPASTDGHTDQP